MFEDASASIPLRQIDRVFEGAGIRLGEDPGGPGGSRRTQFRRYVAGVDAHDPQQLERLGDALGALIEEVATSKQDYLVKAAERDGFFFAGGVFRLAEIGAPRYAVTRVEDLALIDDYGKRLHLIASESPNDAISGAMELVGSVCRTVLRLAGEPTPEKAAGIVAIVKSTFTVLESVPRRIDDAKAGADVIRRCFEQLSAVIASLGELQDLDGSGEIRDSKWNALSPRYARLAVGAAVTLAGFIAETYVERLSELS